MHSDTCIAEIRTKGLVEKCGLKQAQLEGLIKELSEQIQNQTEQLKLANFESRTRETHQNNAIILQSISTYLGSFSEEELNNLQDFLKGLETSEKNTGLTKQFATVMHCYFDLKKEVEDNSKLNNKLHARIHQREEDKGKYLRELIHYVEVRSKNYRVKDFLVHMMLWNVENLLIP